MRLALRAMALAAGLAAAASAFAAPQLSGPLAPAASGRLLCKTPDPNTKTCESLSAYRIDAAGMVRDTSVLLFLEGTTIETTTPVTIRGDRVCGTLRARDIDAARVMADDGSGPVSADKAASVRAEFKLGFGDSFDKEVCTGFEHTDAGLVAKATVNGERDSGLDRMAAWVSQAEGYRAAP